MEWGHGTEEWYWASVGKCPWRRTIVAWNRPIRILRVKSRTQKLWRHNSKNKKVTGCPKMFLIGDMLLLLLRWASENEWGILWSSNYILHITYLRPLKHSNKGIFMAIAHFWCQTNRGSKWFTLLMWIFIWDLPNATFSVDLRECTGQSLFSR